MCKGLWLPLVNSSLYTDHVDSLTGSASQQRIVHCIREPPVPMQPPTDPTGTDCSMRAYMPAFCCAFVKMLEVEGASGIRPSMSSLHAPFAIKLSLSAQCLSADDRQALGLLPLQSRGRCGVQVYPVHPRQSPLRLHEQLLPEQAQPQAVCPEGLHFR